MIRSMTGFGKYELVKDKYKISVEIKTVNHRYLDLSLRMPRIFNCFESAIRNAVKEDVQRGKADMYIMFESESDEGTQLKYNRNVAKAYVDYISQISADFGLKNELTALQLSKMPDVITIEQEDQDVQEFWPDLCYAIHMADKALLQSRETEGINLRTDLLEKLEKMEGYVAEIEKRAPETVAEYRNRLLKKLQDILEDVKLDENRIAAEVTIYADKVCVDEEMVRLKTHIKHMKEELEKGDGIGRKLDFLAQEMNREANTTLSKINDVCLADVAVEMKTEIEKIREQVQNIE